MPRTRGTRIRIAVIAILGMSIVAAFPSAARACSCAQSTPQEMLARSDVVFVGRVVQVVSVPGIGQYSTQATLNVHRLFKGPSQPEFMVLGGSGGGADCTVSFALDEEYLVYATNSGQSAGALQTSICQRTQLARDAQADLAALGEPIRLSGGFRAFWEQYGGLAIFGHPLTNEFRESGMVVQYFERARFEWQPGVWPERYDVLLGFLGRETINGRLRLTGPYPSDYGPPSAQPSCRFFPMPLESSVPVNVGYSVCNGFRAYWEQFGGLPIFGYPISQEFVDPVTGLTVQYFERARFEWQPGTWPERYDVQLGRLGAEFFELP